MWSCSALTQTSVTEDYIAESGADIYAVGGPASEALEDVVDAEELVGANRYETAVMVAEEFFDRDGFVVASGQAFPDALAGAVFSSGESEMPVLLAQRLNLPDVTTDYIRGDQTALHAPDAYLLGGTSALSNRVLRDTEEALGSGN